MASCATEDSGIRKVSERNVTGLNNSMTNAASVGTNGRRHLERLLSSAEYLDRRARAFVTAPLLPSGLTELSRRRAAALDAVRSCFSQALLQRTQHLPAAAVLLCDSGPSQDVDARANAHDAKTRRLHV